jgi:hypothetical protein
MKRLSVFLVLILALTNLSALASGNPKSGSACKNLNQVRNYKGVEFKCEKVGKKRVWVKKKASVLDGKGIPSPNPSASQRDTSIKPTPAPASPSPTPSFLPSPTMSPNAELRESPKLHDPEVCRLKDQRKNQTLRLDHFERNNGFPLQGATLPTKGKLRILTFLVDFSDALGTEEDLRLYRAQEKVMVDWFAEASDGKLTAEIITSDKWFRAPKVSSEYELKPSQYGMHPTYAQEFINLTGSSFNWDGVHAFMVHFPQSQKTKFQSAQLGRAIDLNTPQGRKSLNYQYLGPWHIEFARKVREKNPDYLAGQWLHEHLHDLGLTLHAPGNGFYTGLGQNQASYSKAMSAWELFKLDWLEDSQVFCSPISSIDGTLVNLVPLEVKGIGNKVAILVIDKSKALVIESRRAEGLSDRWPKNLSGLYVYMIDTSADTDRSQEFNGSGLDNGNNKKYSKWAFYLDSDQRPIDETQPESKLDPEKFYQEWLIRVGETVTTDGVIIHFRMSGKTDWIEIKKK